MPFASNTGDTEGKVEFFRVLLNSVSCSVSLDRSGVLSSSVDDGDAMEIGMKISLANALSGAYTSSGYPTSTKVSDRRLKVHSAFVEPHNISVRSLTLPPEETIVFLLAPTSSSSSATAAQSSDILYDKTHASSLFSKHNFFAAAGGCQPLMRIVWRRGDCLQGTTVPAAAHCMSLVKRSSLPASKKFNGFVFPRPLSVPDHSYVLRHPDGIQSVQVSPRLDELLLNTFSANTTTRTSTTTADVTTDVPPNNKAVTDDVALNNDEKMGDWNKCTGLDDLEKGTGEKTCFGLPVEGVAVQLTLVFVNTFSHITMYAVRHQEGRLLEIVPLQTIYIYMSTLRITAQCPFLLGMIMEKMLLQQEARAVETSIAAKESGKKRRSKNLLKKKGVSDSVFFLVPPKTLRYSFDSVNEGVTTVNFGGVDTRSLATQHVVVEPFILLGNQSGNLLFFSILKKKVIQRLNCLSPDFCGNSGGSVSTPCRQIVNNPVSCITEIECGIEKNIASFIDCARLCGVQGKNSFTMPTPFSSGGAPSVFAAGFDNGHVLLVCVTLQGAWLSRHISTFAQDCINGIATRIPHFFTRLWAGKVFFCPEFFAAQSTERQQGEKKHFHNAGSVVYIPIHNMIVDEESAYVAAACNDGTLRVFRALDMEAEVCRVTAAENGAVGGFLAVQWVPSCAATALCPDMVVVTNEDDTVTLYQLRKPQCDDNNMNGIYAMSGNQDMYFKDGGLGTLLPSKFSRQAQTGPPIPFSFGNDFLVFLTQRRFHNSWVGDLCVLPIFSSVGYLLACTSFDGRTSFWPLHCDGDLATSFVGSISLPFSSTAAYSYNSVLPPFFNDVSLGHVISQEEGERLLAAEPAVAVALSADMTTCCGSCGAGKSYFLVSVCLRGQVKFWETRLVLA